MSRASLKLFNYIFVSLFFILFSLSTPAFSEKPSISIRVLENPESNPVIKTLPKADIEREISTVLIGSGYRLTLEQSSDIMLEVYVGIRATENKAAGVTYNTVADVFIRAKDRGGELITEVRDSSYKTGSTVGDSSLEALKVAGAGAARKLRSELEERNRQAARAEFIQVSFSGLRSYVQYERIDKIIAKSLSGVSIRKRVFKPGGEVSFQLSSKASAEELAKTIQGSLPGDIAVKLERSSYDHIWFSLD
ncbi:MAG TPA: hypothetical protein VNN20_04765 [Thermodesulfobacteriota bacterium]|nr:hypothetical protein [Thermodesulfobacteriota bacterium]